MTLLGTVPVEMESGFTGSVDRLVDVAQPIRATLATRYDRGNAAYTFQCQAVIEYGSLTAAEAAMPTHTVATSGLM